MFRHTFAMKIRENNEDDFRLCLRPTWQLVRENLDKLECSNFSLWNADNLVFGYMELPGDIPDKGILPEEQCGWISGLETGCRGTFDWLQDPRKQMRLMYSNIGIVRNDKELIRHRVFITQLRPGMEDEYRKRHKELEDQQGNIVDPGPDSNFTIWSAAGYIFGYDEIDTTLEKRMTAVMRADTIKWEKGMLEIMDWITDDVDWITGFHHPHIRRLAWHN